MVARPQSGTSLDSAGAAAGAVRKLAVLRRPAMAADPDDTAGEVGPATEWSMEALVPDIGAALAGESRGRFDRAGMTVLGSAADE